MIVVLEVMLIQIRENDNIESIDIGNFDIKLSAFADDTYFLTLDIQSLRHISLSSAEALWSKQSMLLRSSSMRD